MDRFIASESNETDNYGANLKSNMDRFIVYSLLVNNFRSL